jgi:hypothetical protein
MLFDLKSNWESNTKKIENIHRFPTIIYLPSSEQQFRRYSFLPDDGAAEICNSGQIAVLRERNKSGAIRVGFFP